MDFIQKARDILESCSVEIVDRPQIVAFASLSAFCEHFPESRLPHDLTLLKKWEHILECEYDRFVKQRRLALSHLCKILCP